ncbi:MAG: hypothetical protein V7K69_20025 [Nostoc sp.]|uniref:hypothetical protein n=1 Tax=Nostoc sp. TaxID=1180 RepID=UPI002FFADA04
MSDYTFGRKKASTSNFSNPSLVSSNTPTLANPTRGFGLPTNNTIQTATEESTNFQETQSADEQSLLSEFIQQESFGHDISHIALRRPQAKLMVGTAGDKYEQEADRTAAQVMSMPNAGVQPIQREAMPEEDEIQTKPLPASITHYLTLQRESGHTSTAFSKPLVVQRDSKPKSVDNRITDLEKQQKMLAAKQQATTLDLRWRGQFGELLSNYRQSIYRISGSFQKATTNFQATQTAQMQMDAVWAQVIALIVTVSIAGLFEPVMGGLGKALGKSEEQVKNWALKELLENPLNTAASGSANVATTIRGNDKANDRQTPAVQGGGVSAADPLSYLTQNLEQIEKHTQGIENAFSTRATKAETMTADEWEKWEPKAEEAKYKSLMDELKPIGPDIAKLKSAEEIAKIVERHLWAAWIRSHVPVVKAYGEHAQHKDAKTRTADDYDSVAISLGSEVEDKLNAIGISALAGVKLTGHWYTDNSEKYRVKLFVWANNYSEKISNE